jgi:hypothetical protein
MTVRDKSVVMSVEPNSAAAAQKVQVRSPEGIDRGKE